ncbi:MAG TPA: pyruvate kinase [Candidatus Nanopelagicaceae bacterium]|nr:pyruvate kinase [Candidatus Nanopelagicaceae bacterium]
MRRAKIVCTLGPSSESVEQLTALVAAGMDVARLNLSHGSYEEHEVRYRRVRQVAAAAGHPLAILADLQGPKIRLGRFADGPHELAVGDLFTITTDEVVGTKDIVSTTYKGLTGDVAAGDRILIDDGRVGLEVLEVAGPQVKTRCIEAGPVSNNKGLNLPGVAVSVPALSDKDEEDLRWALRIGVDWIALSFVRTAEDIEGVHRIMDQEGIRIPVMAKIEKPQAVTNLAAIVAAFDGIMVARGDLGVELPIENIPIVQKQCVSLARNNAKPVIVATQMLDSMITASRPTRAEVTDCANAVLDGADALMLSGETSVGHHAVESVATMSRIIEKIETDALDMIPKLTHAPRTKGGAITKAAVEVGEMLGAKFLVAFTQSGDSARRMSRLRSRLPILALTPEPGTFNRMALTWGVEPILVQAVGHTDDMVKQVDRALINGNRAEIGELVMIVAGAPPGIPGSTNAMRVHRVGDAIGGVAPAYR